ncbi:MAG: pseudouridine synthase [Candidatus Tyloplasma litorale]|nr:MAG: pseudouridine synthase [Mycoplasmatales bacterium]
MNKEERIQKLISNYGSFSRRQVDKFLKEGHVKVNGKVAVVGQKASVNDKIEINNKIIKFNLKHEYFLLNKPKGYISQRQDEKGREVISLINNYKNRNLFTVGRLDYNTTGLIIVTSDGELSNKVMHPSNKVKKTYLVWVDKPLTKEIILSLKLGTKLDDGYVTKKIDGFKLINNEEGKVMVKMIISEGKKNQIKRMFLANNRKVLNLKRIQIGNLKLEGIDVGQNKKLTKSEIYNGLGVKYE